MLRLCLTAFVFFRHIRPSSASEDEFRLLRDLRENYDNVERPVLNHTQAVDVKLRVILQQILNVDAKDQTLTLVLWLQFSWSDYNMIWSPEEYGGISQIQLPAGTLWRPDVLLFNSADNFDSRFDVNFIVKHDGTVQQVPPAIVKCSCNIDITWFPFDEQMCILNFGSWTYTGNLLNLTIDDPNNGTGVHMMDVSYYVPNGEWDLVATPAKRVTNPFLSDFYVELHFYLHMRRKVVYYGINWLIPALLFLLTSVLGFSLPSQCGEKITLQTTNLLSMTSFLGIVSSYTPPSTSVPVIAVFFSFSMIILGLSVIFTVLVINFHFRSPKTHKMSPWVRTIFLEWMPWLLLMQRSGKQMQKPKPTVKPPTTLGRSDSTASRLARAAEHLTLVRARNRSVGPQEDGQPMLAESDEKARMNRGNLSTISDIASLAEVRKAIEELREYLRSSKERMQEDDDEDEIQTDWQYMAGTIDRACLFLYAVLTVALPVYMILAIPPSALPPGVDEVAVL